MRAYYSAFALLSVISCIEAFTSSVLPSSTGVSSSTAIHVYIPDGLTKEEWEKIKAKERAQKSGLGRVGPKGFKSRSFQSFQEALERGEAAHQMPVFNAKEKLKKGEIKLEDIPYMQRGGSWVCVSTDCI
jgi:hypothetical protein